ncbi:MAG: ATP-binding protein [Anaerolineae bacterium]
MWANYIANGLKYGGQPPRLELGSERRQDGTAIFWVRDWGPGISPQNQPAIFTEFTRLQPGHDGGHGLGLSIVRRIVEKLGGQVGVESEGVPGQGSKFFFTLPAAPP